MGLILSVGTIEDIAEWAALRHALWPRHTPDDHRNEIRTLLDEPDTKIGFLARSQTARLMGFAEAALRHEHVNGCSSSPVLFLEGVFVCPAHRHRGIARSLVAAVSRWGRSQGCLEFASDASLDNAASYAMHMALGFSETERVVFFRKPL